MAQVVLGFLAASHFSSDISDRMTSLDKSKESQKFRIIRISLSFF